MATNLDHTAASLVSEQLHKNLKVFTFNVPAPESAGAVSTPSELLFPVPAHSSTHTRDIVTHARDHRHSVDWCA